MLFFNKISQLTLRTRVNIFFFLKKNEHHHHHHYDLFKKLKPEERIKNEDKEVSSSSEYRRRFENARVAA
jgi:hypothetical protein